MNGDRNVKILHKIIKNFKILFKSFPSKNEDFIHVNMLTIQ